MKSFIKQKLILFFSSIILMLPISNALHFVLIDHSTSTEASSTKITHQCDDFVLNQMYTFSDFNLEIVLPIWFDSHFNTNVYYAINYHFNFSIEINNKGPPVYSFSA